MRIVLDLQACQTGSRFRGIGRYSGNLAEEMARQARGHELWIVLNGTYLESIEPIRARFDGLIPQDRIVVWDSLSPAAGGVPPNGWRTRASEEVRDEIIASIQPDIVHVASLFEGLWEDAAVSVVDQTTGAPAVVTLYDLIPYRFRDFYLRDRESQDWYFRKLGQLRNARLLLAISEHTRLDAIDALDLPPDAVVNISGAVDALFRQVQLPQQVADGLLHRLEISRPFVLYTGATDYRKNVEGAIRAFAELPAELRGTHQLVVVSAVDVSERGRLQRVAAAAGLPPDALVMVGFVPDDELVILYNHCKVFIFPSFHEGFGLPAVEAMACGAPVIASNTSCFPEIIGRVDALFEPSLSSSIAQTMGRVLSDETFRRSLSEHGLHRAKRFTWRASARTALEAMEQIHSSRDGAPAIATVAFGKLSARKRLAYVSPLPPEWTGIAEYSAKLVPALARHYDIELITPQSDVSDPWLRSGFPIRTPEWFDRHVGRYDRVLYHMGNSPFHTHMLDLVARHGGVVALHDFFLSSLLAHLEISGERPGVWTEALYDAHGHAALRKRAATADFRDTRHEFHCNHVIVGNADGILVHSDHARKLGERAYGANVAATWRVVPSVSKVADLPQRALARARLGLGLNDFLVCSFGFVDPTKLHHRILDAWLASPLATSIHAHLVFVGNSANPDYHPVLAKRLGAVRHCTRTSITGFVDAETYRGYLAAADAAVQLRADSRGETSAALLDCLACGLPTVVNAHGAFAELPDDSVIKLKDGFTDNELVDALIRLHSDRAWGQAIGKRAVDYVQAHHSPQKCAEKFRDAIEHFAGSRPYAAPRHVLKRIDDLKLPIAPTEVDKGKFGASLRWIHKSRPGQRQLFLDLSTIAMNDIGGGIPRVVKCTLREMLGLSLPDTRVEPVYSTKSGEYRYARRLTGELVGFSTEGLSDDLLDAKPGDIFLGLDWAPETVCSSVSFYRNLRNHGVEVYFVVYDLLPVLLPDKFPKWMAPFIAEWLAALGALSSGIICISRTVADELTQWYRQNPVKHLRPIRIGFFHLGADIQGAANSPAKAKAAAQRLLPSSRPALLVVGTVEPRKGYAQALAAFEQLWADSVDIDLVIVGKPGWMSDALIKRLRTHPQKGKRMIWHESPSDDVLLHLYMNCAGLLMASEAEGFGLPLVEAARHGLPILSRDIPVFREIAGENAHYFNGTAPQDLAAAIRTWLALWKEGSAPASDGIHPISWNESAKQLLDVVLNGQWYQNVEPTAGARTTDRNQCKP